MATEPCDACGRSVRIAGGVANVWSFETGPSGGMTLELVDDSEHFLCFDCVERLPGDREPTREDVAAVAAEREPGGDDGGGDGE
ncbi:hypothetical protein BRC94_12550 [Halobacteriales archaeon QS_5_70_17]|jgi:hypothetical protein|nr:MAG: hypothetical protein BRC94_12550 [Halobacteriales archaeon QS_5_70_17]